MLTYIIKRLMLMIPTFFAICVMVFVILNFAPGNPVAVRLGQRVDSSPTPVSRRVVSPL